MSQILLIEDEPALRELIAALLESAGHTVTMAEHGRIGVTLLAEGRFDLVITDLLMPEQDGIETILQARVLEPGLPVLAITGGGKIDAAFYLRVARAVGATRLLRKPFSRDELLSNVSSLLAPRGMRPAV